MLTFANSDRYEGSFVDGRMEGAGIMTYADGSEYRGDWYNGLKQGLQE